ncbi:hypothetical protein [Actinoplanes regularis]|uniref:hypothetical protein n=1 Tax=Actinoplanes regularis TaxID=52697 RepID=UPI0024A43452|nr:hypothetical protein [Actinoplanes regularis]GLW34562.1 hypothetical protein Areg01_74990 [Actinoplanes regularis]
MFGRRLELDATVVAITTEVVSEWYPDEIDMLAEIRTPPRAHRLRAPVGMGVELAAVTPVLLSVLTFIAGTAATQVVEGALGRLGTAARERLASFFRPDRPPVTSSPEADLPRIEAALAEICVEQGMRTDLAREVAKHVVSALRRRLGQPG